MSKLLPFPNLREARREASEWVVRLDRGLTPEERTTLRSWSATPQNRRALREMAALWNDMNVLGALAEVLPREREDVCPVTAARRRRQRMRGFAAAAAVAVLALGGALWLQRTHRVAPAPSASAVPVQTLETPVGERRTVALADGSELTLNTDTRVAVAFGEGRRELTLDRGEAHFRVAHDPSHPFRVHVAGRVVQAVGTAFTVRLRPSGELEVLVTEGRVRVEAAQTQLVDAQQLLELDARGQPHLQSLPAVDMDIREAWQRGMVVFRGESLPDVLAEFGRYTTARFVIRDARLRELRVGGYFRAGDVDALLVALRENFHIRTQRLPDGEIQLTAAD